MPWFAFIIAPIQAAQRCLLKLSKYLYYRGAACDIYFTHARLRRTGSPATDIDYSVNHEPTLRYRSPTSFTPLVKPCATIEYVPAARPVSQNIVLICLIRVGVECCRILLVPISPVIPVTSVPAIFGMAILPSPPPIVRRWLAEDELTVEHIQRRGGRIRQVIPEHHRFVRNEACATHADGTAGRARECQKRSGGRSLGRQT